MAEEIGTSSKHARRPEATIPWLERDPHGDNLEKGLALKSQGHHVKRRERRSSDPLTGRHSSDMRGRSPKKYGPPPPPPPPQMWVPVGPGHTYGPPPPPPPPPMWVPVGPGHTYGQAPPAPPNFASRTSRHARRRDSHSRNDHRQLSSDGSFNSSNHDADVIWNPDHASNVTVHLKMPLGEHLDDDLEEFCRLQRLGDFLSARRFFDENLQSHLDKPHILVEYMEMLLEQGNYNAISYMEERPMRSTIRRIEDEKDSELFMSYLDLIKASGAFHRADIPWIDLRKVITQGLNTLHTAIDPEEYDEEWDISSTEIKMLALIFRLNDVLWEELPDQFLDLSSPNFGRKLYSMLLRNGRIWDLHDIAVAQLLGLENSDISEYWSDEPSFQERIQRTLSDWLNENGRYDVSTVLALLGLLMCFTITLLAKGKAADQKNIEYILEQSIPLASFIIENDPNKMQSRPFMMWIIAKAMFADGDGLKNIVSQHEYLKSLPGIFFVRGNGLPIYVPKGTETPTWKPEKVGPEFEKSLRMVLKKSSAAGDYRTEAMTLAALIRISTKPEMEFTYLGNLQKLTQGSIHDYCQTLASRYLMLNTEESRNSVRTDISDLFSTPRLSKDMSKLDIEYSWVLRKILQSLEAKESDPPTSDNVDEAISRNSHETIGKRTLNVETRPFQTDTAHDSLPSTKGEGGQDKPGSKQNVTGMRRENLGGQEHDNSNSCSNISRDFEFFAKPHMLKGKRVIIAFEDVENPSAREEISYQFDAEKNRELLEKMNPSSQVLVRARKDGKIVRMIEISEATEQSKDQS
ncbi:hypothetical protein F5B19DRAFT_267905 [Rostrohypoxylon terebratum]|nr:hypothetical protein F5B19DRAFT_267905 [Rostrohypoxylon terebratum]